MSVPLIDMSTLSESNNEKDVTASGFKLGDDVYNITKYATEPAAAIARLAAGDMLEDKFGNYERISIEDLISRNVGSWSWPDSSNAMIASVDFLDEKITFKNGQEEDCHPLIYVNEAEDAVIIETHGVLIRGEQTSGIGQGPVNLYIYNPRDNIDQYTAFCSDNGIDETTKLGMTILLKQLLVSEGYDIAELDKVMADPQPEALAFYQQIISPALEAMITLAMSSFKKFADFIKQIITGSMKG